MKITFDSDEQKQQVINSFCIDELYIDRKDICSQNCEACWEKYVQMEVDDE